MGFLWPKLLLLLSLIPLAIIVYIGVLRRPRFAVRYSSLVLVHEASSYTWLRRHLAFILLLLALTSLVIAAARPFTYEKVLSGQTTIMLTMDVSRSMCSIDIPPNRLEAAKTASRLFVHQPIPGTQIGIVAFAGFAELAQEPTTQTELLEQTITSLTTSTETAIGSAILRALDAIAEVDKSVAPSNATRASPNGGPPASASASEHKVPHVIILLTDGASNTGPSPIDAAQQAAARGVRIYTIGFGTTQAAVMDCWNSIGEAFSIPNTGSPAGGGIFGSEPDEATLKQIAKMTGGKFYTATSAAELQTVFARLSRSMALTDRTIEISVFFAAFGVLIAIIALLLSFLWHPLL